MDKSSHETNDVTACDELMTIDDILSSVESGTISFETLREVLYGDIRRIASERGPNGLRLWLLDLLRRLQVRYVDDDDIMRPFFDFVTRELEKAGGVELWGVFE